ncbi:hypothetical protein SADUNF_Sadunf06G0083900 [Salix dunnii]|uniref:Uncharacterized protein n=1 Tax=Salix dunnii TaxID=1413687 RepID=A0A835K1J7_9ROSI|nr:hypothetical protein SADUNF_Sadunf06G0083900 [Salix dunnii]
MIGKNVSPGARVWKALLLSSGFKLGCVETKLFSLVDSCVETKLFSLVDSNQTLLSCESVAVDSQNACKAKLHQHLFYGRPCRLKSWVLSEILFLSNDPGDVALHPSNPLGHGIDAWI